MTIPAEARGFPDGEYFSRRHDRPVVACSSCETRRPSVVIVVVVVVVVAESRFMIGEARASGNAIERL